ncbi:phosphoglucomutase, partial [Pseudomonas sp. MPR-R5A]
GIDGSAIIAKILSSFRENPPLAVGELKLEATEDYLTSVRTEVGGNESTIDLPKSNVLKYFFDDGTWICLRPSGTEPKIKFYFGVNGESLEQ